MCSFNFDRLFCVVYVHSHLNSIEMVIQREQYEINVSTYGLNHTQNPFISNKIFDSELLTQFFHSICFHFHSGFQNIAICIRSADNISTTMRANKKKNNNKRNAAFYKSNDNNSKLHKTFNSSHQLNCVLALSLFSIHFSKKKKLPTSSEEGGGKND